MTFPFLYGAYNFHCPCSLVLIARVLLFLVYIYSSFIAFSAFPFTVAMLCQIQYQRNFLGGKNQFPLLKSVLQANTFPLDV